MKLVLGFPELVEIELWAFSSCIHYTNVCADGRSPAPLRPPGARTGRPETSPVGRDGPRDAGACAPQRRHRPGNHKVSMRPWCNSGSNPTPTYLPQRPMIVSQGVPHDVGRARSFRHFPLDPERRPTIGSVSIGLSALRNRLVCPAHRSPREPGGPAFQPWRMQ